MNTNPTILTGDRPTGRCISATTWGSLRQRGTTAARSSTVYPDRRSQGLTDNGSDPQKISSNIFEVMADYLAVGIDHTKPRFACNQRCLPWRN